ncbi:PilT/PilU family type 4a pilus ATPase [Myxococcota bacterium]|nr:PilT/PilU family type 4a pilus ATPase [Myxococcota bacterium]
MTDPRALLAEFRAAPWSSSADLDDFVGRCQALPPARAREVLDLALRPPAGHSPRQVQAMTAIACRLVLTHKDGGAGPAIIDALRTADPSLHRFLVPTLVQLNDPAWHPQVFALLRHKEERVRQAARDVLVKVGGRTVFGLIEDSLRESWPGRVELVDVVAEVAGHHGIPILAALFEQCDRPERVRILQVLGEERYVKVRREEALAVLRRALSDGDSVIRGRAAGAVARLGDADAVPALAALVRDPSPYCAKAAVAALATLAGLEVAAALHELGEATRAPVLDVQVAAVEALGQWGGIDAVPPLVGVIESAPLALRNAAIDALGQIGRSGRADLARILLIMSQRPEVGVRRAVVELIGLVGDPDGTLWRRLVRALRDEDWWVRESATEVLVEVGGPQVVPHVVELLAEESDVVRRYAVEVLLRLKAHEALPHLARAARDDTDWWVRERAIEALGELGDARAVPLLVSMLGESDYHFVIVQALGRLRDPRAVPYLAPLAELGDPDFRMLVARTLAEIGGERAAAALRERIADPDREVRRFVLQALQDLQVSLDSADVERAALRHLTLLERMLEATREAGGTDLYYFPGAPPSMKLSGRVVPLGSRPLEVDDVQEALRQVFRDESDAALAGQDDRDAAFQSRGGRERYRVHAFRRKGGVNVVFRVIRDEIMPFDQLGLPPHVLEFTDASSGLLIVSGPSGSGKTTTLSALVDHVNRTSARHVITLEDPIEALHHNARSMIHQREVSARTGGARRALRGLLRQDPDVILIGEMRDLDTVSFAVTAAETGHLVLATFHTTSAAQTIERLIDIFPNHQQSQVRAMISESLLGVVCQQLLGRRDGQGRVLAAEILVNNTAVAHMIRQGKAHQIPNLVATSYEAGMREMDREMLSLVERGVARADEAYAKAQDKKTFERFFQPEEPAAEPRPLSAAGGRRP